MLNLKKSATTCSSNELGCLLVDMFVAKDDNESGEIVRGCFAVELFVMKFKRLCNG